ncbi:diguanylate cyclase [Catenovulum agarivorans DS-2]|uniref:diguanylate cyclase n=1 Tax=Catenovulum agarivorans DS-2 TaxID=1328313 RepID=W7QQF2_9ALTE|nr:diguanylate cyclase [Catenovulum agarivorans]EWH11212.1 diguanylate cyclase [Catenovulum agarivorans DS-2]
MTQQPGRGKSFVKRVYFPRVIGFGLGALPVGAVIYQQDLSNLYWIGVIFSAFIWPQLAFWLGMRAKHHFKSEFNSLFFDSVIVGFWAAAMGFNIVPSILLLSASGLNNMSAGGVKFYCIGWGAVALGIAAHFLIAPPYLNLTSTELTMMICAPLALFYPLLVGFVTYRLSKKLSEERKMALLMSQTDSLSQLPNRGFWEAKVRETFEHGKTYAETPALVMIDIDHFKAINDNHGHLVGDKVLIAFSDALKSFFNGTNAILGRYGGEEFGVLIPNADPHSSEDIANAFRIFLQKESLQTCKQLNISLTVSAGIAVLTSDIKDFSQWIDIADQALYDAKANGRNQVCLAQQQYVPKLTI